MKCSWWWEANIISGINGEAIIESELALRDAFYACSAEKHDEDILFINA